MLAGCVQPLAQLDAQQAGAGALPLLLILLPNETDAQSVETVLKNGGDFIQLARERSMDQQTAAQGGLLPPVMRAEYPDVWKAIANLKPGLTEIIVHLGHDDAELQAVTVNHEPYGSAWRQRDYDVVTSPEFKKALEDNHVVLVRWRDLQTLAK